MRASYDEDPLDTLKIVAYVRDIRGGKGERKLARQMYLWLAKNEPESMKNNLIHYVSVYGNRLGIHGNKTLGRSIKSLAR